MATGSSSTTNFFFAESQDRDETVKTVRISAASYSSSEVNTDRASPSRCASFWTRADFPHPLGPLRTQTCFPELRYQLNSWLASGSRWYSSPGAGGTGGTCRAGAGGAARPAAAPGPPGGRGALKGSVAAGAEEQGATGLGGEVNGGGRVRGADAAIHRVMQLGAAAWVGSLAGSGGPVTGSNMAQEVGFGRVVGSPQAPAAGWRAVELAEGRAAQVRFRLGSGRRLLLLGLGLALFWLVLARGGFLRSGLFFPLTGGRFT